MSGGRFRDKSVGPVVVVIVEVGTVVLDVGVGAFPAFWLLKKPWYCWALTANERSLLYGCWFDEFVVVVNKLVAFVIDRIIFKSFATAFGDDLGTFVAIDRADVWVSESILDWRPGNNEDDNIVSPFWNWRDTV